MLKIKKILAPTDLTEGSLTGTKYAIALAGEYQAEVVVLHVVDTREIPKVTSVPYEAVEFFRVERVPIGGVAQRLVDLEVQEEGLDLYHFLSEHVEPEIVQSVKLTRLV